MYVTYHFKGSFVSLKWNLYIVLFLVFLFYDTLVNAFYFHKHSYIYELIKLNKCNNS